LSGLLEAEIASKSHGATSGDRGDSSPKGLRDGETFDLLKKIRQTAHCVPRQSFKGKAGVFLNNLLSPVCVKILLSLGGPSSMERRDLLLPWGVLLTATQY
jgi:hypothetical protein